MFRQAFTPCGTLSKVATVDAAALLTPQLLRLPGRRSAVVAAKGIGAVARQTLLALCYRWHRPLMRLFYCSLLRLGYLFRWPLFRLLGRARRVAIVAAIVITLGNLV